MCFVYRRESNVQILVVWLDRRRGFLCVFHWMGRVFSWFAWICDRAGTDDAIGLCEWKIAVLCDRVALRVLRNAPIQDSEARS